MGWNRKKSIFQPFHWPQFSPTTADGWSIWEICRHELVKPQLKLWHLKDHWKHELFTLRGSHTTVLSQHVDRAFLQTASFWHNCLMAMKMQKQPNKSAVIGCIVLAMQIFCKFSDISKQQLLLMWCGSSGLQRWVTAQFVIGDSLPSPCT